MEKVDFYKKRYKAMDLFYSWVDQGSEYDMAVASRFAIGGRTLSRSFNEDVMNAAGMLRQ